MSDREAMKLALEALKAMQSYAAAERKGLRICDEAIEALRARLAAPQPEPVAWMYVNSEGECEQIEYGTEAIDDDSITLLYAAPPAAAPEPTHPGYVIGNHWLEIETAYSRICAGEAKADVLKDCGRERVTDAEALRREAERYRRLLDWLVETGLLTRERCRIDSPASYGDWWILRKPKVIDGSSLIGYGKTEDAAIDAAMEPATEPAIRARGQEDKT